MAITATITNITRDGNSIRVFADFTDGDSKSYLFDATITKATAVGAIKSDVDFKNSLDAKVEASKAFIGTVVS